MRSVVCNGIGSWEDEYTEEQGEDALAFEDWIERIADGGVTWVNDDGELETRFSSAGPGEICARGMSGSEAS